MGNMLVLITLPWYCCCSRGMTCDSLWVRARPSWRQHWFALAAEVLSCFTHSLYAWSFARRTWLCPFCESGILVPPELLGLWNIPNDKLLILLDCHHVFSVHWWEWDRSSYWLRSWILRKMKKMRMAMRTMAMPAPITIPTIWRERNRRWRELQH